jgi:hypothetical protein
VGVEANWLAARAAPDKASRQATIETLLPALSGYLRPGPDTDVAVIDVGAGSGSNQRWLATRLPFRQRWVHLDHDPAILEHTHDVGHTEFVVGGIDALADLLNSARGPTVITCAAVLDVLTRTELTLLCDLIIDHRVPALLSLSVTGEITIEPPDDLDAALLTAFNAHQRRDGRAGPDAPGLVATRCRAAGLDVRTVHTPWVIDHSSDRAFLAQFLTERVAASVEHDPSLAEPAAEWLRRRLSQPADPHLRIVVGHLDLLVLPSRPEWSEAQPAERY